MPNILIVCTANICRSPMGEAILKRRISERTDADQWHIESAGTHAMDGRGAAIFSEHVMQDLGLNISSHRSQAVNLKLLQKFHLILTMEEAHKKWLQSEYPEFANRTYLISEMVDEKKDISDPIGGDLAGYQKTAELLDQILTQGFDRICQLALKYQDF